MKLLSWLLFLLTACQIHANVKAVFAHFMVSNTGTYTISDWENDITLAREAKIDGFVLNMAKGEATNGDSIANAFIAANNLGSGFKLLFSFDYAGNGLWPKSDVIALIQKYSSNTAYFHRGSQPLVSTFEGPAASDDWDSIKQTTGCFFMPSWSSLGAKPAWELGKADGLFSWAAWPTGPNNMDTFTDASYLDTLNGKPYMMGVSPWFYTNMPGFRKNWMWRGDDLWFDRWTNAIYLQPEYVQIITWNDYGESHHIGPLRDKAYTAFNVGKAPFNYALGKPHDAWRLFLPYLIDMVKTNSTSFSQENVAAWYRPHPKNACGTGGTTGNTASQLQAVFAPGELVDDRVFYAALLGSSATVTVSIGGVASAGTWTHEPSNGVGLYRGSVSFNGRTGAVVVTISRGGQILQASGDAITTSCTQGIQNWNPHTIRSAGRSISPVSPLSLSEVGCTRGFGAKKYQGLCEFTCKYDYCPKGACTCTALGKVNPYPALKNLNGCPAPGIDSTYLGLCSVGCNYGFCPEVCKIYPSTHECTAPNPTAPPVPVCVAGMADGAYSFLCAYTCALGFCPPEICSCTQAGITLPPMPTLKDLEGEPLGDWDYGLCAWACPRGVCPSKFCKCTGTGCPSSDPPKTFKSISPYQITATIKHDLGQYCDRQSDCTNQDDPVESRCKNGLVKLGWDKAGCGKNKGKSICCASGTVLKPDTCIWRGNGYTKTNGGDCNGQCHVGETTVIKSSWGGSPTNGNNNKCGRGVKAFCCSNSDWAVASKGCFWTNCGTSCGSTYEKLAIDRRDCFIWQTPAELCCPKPALIYECEWRGTLRDCADAKCNNDEVAVALSSTGDSFRGGCNWGRQRSSCCKINVPAPPPPKQCDYDLCDSTPALCTSTLEAPSKREVNLEFLDSIGDNGFSLAEDNSLHAFEKRDRRKRIVITYKTVGVSMKDLISRPYSSRGQFIENAKAGGRSFFVYLINRECTLFDVTRTDWSTRTDDPPAKVDTEHVMDVQVIGKFVESCVTGILPDGTASIYGKISSTWFNTVFRAKNSMPNTLPEVTPTSPYLDSPMERVMEVLGSSTNVDIMVLLDNATNGIKGKFFGLLTPLGKDNFVDKVKESIYEGVDSEIWLTWLHKAVAVSDYLNSPEISTIFTDMVNGLGTQFDIVERNTFGANNLASKWGEFSDVYFPKVGQFAREFVAERAEAAARQYELYHPADYGTIMVTLNAIIAKVEGMKVPGY